MTTAMNTHDGVSTTTQDAGTLIVSARPERLGGGVYIGTRKMTVDGIVQARQYIALDRAGASRLLADLATLLAVPEEKPWTPKVGDAVRVVGGGSFDGREGHITQINTPRDGMWPIIVRTGGGTGRWGFNADELAPR